MFDNENKRAGNVARIDRKEVNTGPRRKNLEKRDNFEELGVDGKIILKKISHPLFKTKNGTRGRGKDTSGSG